MESEKENNVNQHLDVNETNILLHNERHNEEHNENTDIINIKAENHLDREIENQANNNSLQVYKDVILNEMIEHRKTEKQCLKKNNNYENRNTKDTNKETIISKGEELLKCSKSDTVVIIGHENMSRMSLKNIVEEKLETNDHTALYNDKKTKTDCIKYNRNNIRQSEQTLSRYSESKESGIYPKEINEDKKEIENGDMIDVPENYFEKIVKEEEESYIQNLEKNEFSVPLIKEPEKYIIYDKEDEEDEKENKNDVNLFHNDFYFDTFKLKHIFLSKENLDFIDRLKEESDKEEPFLAATITTNNNNDYNDNNDNNNNNNNNDSNKYKNVEYYKLNSTTEGSMSVDSSLKRMYEYDYDFTFKKNSNTSLNNKPYISLFPRFELKGNNHNEVVCPHFVTTGNVLIATQKPNMKSLEQNKETECCTNTTMRCAEFYKSCNLFPFKKRMGFSKQTDLITLRNETIENDKQVFYATDNVSCMCNQTKVLPMDSKDNILHTSQHLHYRHINKNNNIVNNTPLNKMPLKEESWSIQNSLSNSFNSGISVNVHNMQNVHQNKTEIKVKTDEVAYTCQCLNYKGIYNRCTNFIKQVKCHLFFCIPNREKLNELIDQPSDLNTNMNDDSIFMIPEDSVTPVTHFRDRNNKKFNNTIEVITKSATNKMSHKEFKDVNTSYNIIDKEINNRQTVICSTDGMDTDGYISANPSKSWTNLFTATNNKSSYDDTCFNKYLSYSKVEKEGISTASKESPVKQNIKMTTSTSTEHTTVTKKVVLQNNFKSANKKTETVKKSPNKVKDFVTYFENIVNRSKKIRHINLKKNVEVHKTPQKEKIYFDENIMTNQICTQCFPKKNIHKNKNNVTFGPTFENHVCYTNNLSCCHKMRNMSISRRKNQNGINYYPTGRPSAVVAAKLNNDPDPFLKFVEVITDPVLIHELDQIHLQQQNQLSQFIQNINEMNMCVGVPDIYYS